MPSATVTIPDEQPERHSPDFWIRGAARGTTKAIDILDGSGSENLL